MDWQELSGMVWCKERERTDRKAHAICATLRTFKEDQGTLRAKSNKRMSSGEPGRVNEAADLLS